jgi:hypothetical protein
VARSGNLPTVLDAQATQPTLTPAAFVEKWRGVTTTPLLIVSDIERIDLG